MVSEVPDTIKFSDEVDESVIAASKIFHFGTLSMTHEGVRKATKKALDAAKQNHVLISFDPNLREPLWERLDDAKEQVAYGMGMCDILKISDNEIEWYTGETDYSKGVAKIRESFDIPLILVSMGKDGSRAYYKDEMIEIPAFIQPDTIETTGAGDTFDACVLDYILKHGMELSRAQITEMLTFANAAALITTQKSALCVMPSREEVLKLL